MYEYVLHVRDGKISVKNCLDKKTDGQTIFSSVSLMTQGGIIQL